MTLFFFLIYFCINIIYIIIHMLSGNHSLSKSVPRQLQQHGEWIQLLYDVLLLFVNKINKFCIASDLSFPSHRLFGGKRVCFSRSVFSSGCNFLSFHHVIIEAIYAIKDILSNLILSRILIFFTINVLLFFKFSCYAKSVSF